MSILIGKARGYETISDLDIEDDEPLDINIYISDKGVELVASPVNMKADQARALAAFLFEAADRFTILSRAGIHPPSMKKP